MEKITVTVTPGELCRMLESLNKGDKKCEKTTPDASDVHIPGAERKKKDPAKKAEGFKPSASMISNAKRGLELRRKYGRGGLTTRQAGEQGISSGVARARDIANGRSLSLQTVRQMNRFFSRHEKNKDTPPEEGNGKIAWLLWGGDSGRAWARSIIAREDKTEKADFVFKQAEFTEDQRIVAGYASVVEFNGEEVVDSQNDVIDEKTIVEAAHDFMKSSRAGKVMHKGRTIGTVVESAVFTKEFQSMHKIDLGMVPWYIVMKIEDDRTWDQVKKGEFTGFSVGGRARRVKYN